VQTFPVIVSSASWPSVRASVTFGRPELIEPILVPGGNPVGGVSAPITPVIKEGPSFVIVGANMI
jgi:hypothetical protein